MECLLTCQITLCNMCQHQLATLDKQTLHSKILIYYFLVKINLVITLLFLWKQEWNVECICVLHVFLPKSFTRMCSSYQCQLPERAVKNIRNISQVWRVCLKNLTEHQEHALLLESADNSEGRVMLVRRAGYVRLIRLLYCMFVESTHLKKKLFHLVPHFSSQERLSKKKNWCSV